MYRVAQTFKLKPGFYDQYKQAHDELWPSIAQSMADNDVSMVIYHHERRLYLFAVAPSKAHWERSAQGPQAEKWEAFIATMMITGDDGKSIVQEMDEAFVFGQFKGSDDA